MQYNGIQKNDDTVLSQKGEVIGMAKGEDLLASLVSAMVKSGADQEEIIYFTILSLLYFI